MNEEDAWPDCAVFGCTNKSWLGANSHFCFPHTPAAIEEMSAEDAWNVLQMEAKYGQFQAGAHS